MKLVNELRPVRIAVPDGRTVEAFVRVRGIDARVAGRGFIIQRFQPETVMVRDRDALRTLAFPRRRTPYRLLALPAAPLASRLIRRLIAPRAHPHVEEKGRSE